MFCHLPAFNVHQRSLIARSRVVPCDKSNTTIFEFVVAKSDTNGLGTLHGGCIATLVCVCALFAIVCIGLRNSCLRSFASVCATQTSSDADRRVDDDFAVQSRRQTRQHGHDRFDDVLHCCYKHRRSASHRVQCRQNWRVVVVPRGAHQARERRLARRDRHAHQVSFKSETISPRPCACFLSFFINRTRFFCPCWHARARCALSSWPATTDAARRRRHSQCLPSSSSSSSSS